MPDVFVVFADVFLNLKPWSKVRHTFHRPRFHVGAWVVDGCFNLQMAEIRTTVSFDEVQSRRHRLAASTEPPLVVEAHCVYDKRLALPAAECMAVPRRVRILRMKTTVEEHLSVPRYLLLKEQDEECWRLDQLEEWPQPEHSIGQAPCTGRIFDVVRRPLLEHGIGGRKQFWPPGVDCGRRPPHTGQIGLAVRHSRSGTRRRWGPVRCSNARSQILANCIQRDTHVDKT